MSPSDHSPSSTDSRFRRSARAAGRLAVWSVLFLLAWAFVASALPGVPTPGDALRATLAGVKHLSDHLYMLAEERELEKSAELVRNAASERGREFDTVQSDAERLSLERRARMPMHPAEEDSSLRAELKSISTVPLVGGRVINILIIGIDSRLSVRDARGDALHLVTINPDSAIVEFMSIPRDTYCDLGYPDSTPYNIIANAKLPGNGVLMRKVAEVTKRGPVNYWIEVGFSQALGILEMLGYKDPSATLQYLRSRKAHATGDLQRCHNQAVFMRQNLIDRFPLLTGASGDLILSAGLSFVTTNLTKDFCLGILYNLKKHGFPDHRRDAVRLRMSPGYNIRLKEMSADSVTVARTIELAERHLGEGKAPRRDVTSYLRRINGLASADSLRPGKVITRLQRLNEQHAWLQVQDPQDRRGIRDTLTILLERAYRKVGKQREADAVVAAREAENLLLRRDMLTPPPR
jgi:hypothetical protein